MEHGRFFQIRKNGMPYIPVYLALITAVICIQRGVAWAGICTVYMVSVAGILNIVFSVNKKRAVFHGMLIEILIGVFLVWKCISFDHFILAALCAISCLLVTAVLIRKGTRWAKEQYPKE